MKLLLKLEEAFLWVLFSMIYFIFLKGTWAFYLALFFVPDVSFALYYFSKKIGTYAYNIAHHKGVMIAIILLGYYCNNNTAMQLGLIFLAHSCFDRLAGYGLKYADSFNHTHLGWIGKEAHKNIV